MAYTNDYNQGGSKPSAYEQDQGGWGADVPMNGGGGYGISDGQIVNTGNGQAWTPASGGALPGMQPNNQFDLSPLLSSMQSFQNTFGTQLSDMQKQFSSQLTPLQNQYSGLQSQVGDLAKTTQNNAATTAGQLQALANKAGGQVTPVAQKQNVYYNPSAPKDPNTGLPVDVATAQGYGMTPQTYNFVPYTSGMQLNQGDVALGGNGVIPDSALGGATRLGGENRQQTEAQIANYMNMPVQHLTEALQQSATGVQSTLGQMQNLVMNLLQQPQPDLTVVMQPYLNGIESTLNNVVAEAQKAYQEGMNDPALLQALELVRSEASGMRTELDETLNARGLAQSGLWVEAMDKFNKGVLTQEQTMVAGHMSQLTQNLQTTLREIAMQRVAVLSNVMGMVSQAEMQKATLGVQRVTAAIEALGSIAQMGQQADQFNQQMTQQNDQFAQNYKLEEAKLAETKRANAASESIARTNATKVDTPQFDPWKADAHVIEVQKTARDLIQGITSGAVPPERLDTVDKVRAYLAVTPDANTYRTQYEDIFVQDVLNAALAKKSGNTPNANLQTVNQGSTYVPPGNVRYTPAYNTPSWDELKAKYGTK